MSAAQSPAQISSLQAARGKLMSGDAAGALTAVRALAPELRAHPDALLLEAAALTRLGQPEPARAALARAVEAAPEHVGALHSYGTLLDQLGRSEDAVDLLERATRAQPANPTLWVDLAIVATRAGRFDAAGAALDRVLGANPANARAWSARAALETARGDLSAAADASRRAVQLDPTDLRSRHNLALRLRELDQTEAALAEIETALRGGLRGPETATTRAHLLAELGRGAEAVEQYRAVIDAVPDYLDAQETLARLLPQIGRGAEALDGYRQALARAPHSAPLWLSALGAAKAVGDHAQLFAWGKEGALTLGDYPEFAIARATGRSLGGDHRGAIEILEHLLRRAPRPAVVHTHLAHNLIAAGDPAQAEQHALAATELDPEGQAAWAYLTVIWRLLDDPREHWLADYERLVMPVDLPISPGGLAELRDSLTRLHVMRQHPADQSLRGGTQTRGDLFARSDPTIRALAELVRPGVERLLAGLPDDPSHPFLRRRAGRIGYQGSWSVRLRSEGFHVSHIHQEGWLSSALYVSLPPEVAQGGGKAQAGALAFGVPDALLGLDLPPRRVEAPKEGRLVLFPSYFWHGTLPFQSAQPRLTVAFDAVPRPG